MMILKYELADVLIENKAVLVAEAGSGIITYATVLAEETFGYTVRNSLLGMCVDQLVPETLRTQHAGDRALFDAAPRRRLMNAGQILSGLRKDGTTIPVIASLLPAVMDGKEQVVVDVVDMSGLPPQLLHLILEYKGTDQRH